MACYFKINSNVPVDYSILHLIKWAHSIDSTFTTRVVRRVCTAKRLLCTFECDRLKKRLKKRKCRWKWICCRMVIEFSVARPEVCTGGCRLHHVGTGGGESGADDGSSCGCHFPLIWFRSFLVLQVAGSAAAHFKLEPWFMWFSRDDSIRQRPHSSLPLHSNYTTVKFELESRIIRLDD